MPLLATGALHYNGWDFDSLVRSKVTAVPMWDEAHRTITYIQYTVDVRGYINARGAGTCDSQMDDLRQALLTPGGEFLYEEKGYGTFNANNHIATDSAWGPFPLRLSADPIGNDQTWLVDWSCQVNLPLCVGGSQ